MPKVWNEAKEIHTGKLCLIMLILKLKKISSPTETTALKPIQAEGRK